MQVPPVQTTLNVSKIEWTLDFFLPESHKNNMPYSECTHRFLPTPQDSLQTKFGLVVTSNHLCLHVKNAAYSAEAGAQKHYVCYILRIISIYVKICVVYLLQLLILIKIVTFSIFCWTMWNCQFLFYLYWPAKIAVSLSNVKFKKLLSDIGKDKEKSHWNTLFPFMLIYGVYVADRT